MPTFTITISGGRRGENRSACETALRYFSGGEVLRGGDVMSDQNGAAYRETEFASKVTKAYVQAQVKRACDGYIVTVE